MAKNYDGIFELTEIIQCGDLIKINQELIKLSSSLKDIIIAKLTKVIANAYAKSFLLAITGLLVPIYKNNLQHYNTKSKYILVFLGFNMCNFSFMVRE